MYTIDNAKVDQIGDAALAETGLQCCKKWSVYNLDVVRIRVRFDCKIHGRYECIVHLVANDRDRRDDEIKDEIKQCILACISPSPRSQETS